MNEEKILYTVSEVAEIIHCNAGFVYDLIKSKQLPALKLGSYKIRKISLERFLEANEGNDIRNPYNILPLTFEN